MNLIFRPGMKAPHRVIALGCVMALLLVACNETSYRTSNQDHSGDLPEELATPSQGLELLPWIDFHEVNFDHTDFVAIDEANKVITVTGPALSVASRLEMGDVFFGDIHGGFAVQVVEVQEQGESIVVEYRDLVLTNLMHGDWEMALDLSGVRYEDADLSTLHQELVQKDWSFTYGEPGDLLHGSAHAAINIAPELNFDGKAHLRALRHDFINEEFGDATCANALLDHDRWGTKAQICADFLHVSLGLEANAEAHARLEAEFTRGGVHEIVLLDRQYEDVELIGPLALTAGVTVTARATGNGHAEGHLDLQAEAGIYAPIGFEWHHEDGFRALTPIRDGNRHFNFESDAYAHVDLNASFTLEAELHLSLTVKGFNSVGFGGMGAGAKLHTEAQYLPLGDAPCLTAGATFDSYFNGKVTAFVDASRLMLGTHEWDLVNIDHQFDRITLADWNDNGRFCLNSDQRIAAELTRLYNQDCSDQQNAFYGSCTQNMLSQCFAPPSGCQGYVDGSRNILMVWPSGERVEIRREQAGDIILDVSEYYGDGGDLCGSSELYVQSSAPAGQCVSEEFFTLEQDQTPVDPHLDEEEIQEMYDSGWLLRAGAEASACASASGSGYNMDLACPRPEDDSSFGVSSAGVQPCAVGIGRCSFELVDSMPLPSLSGAW